jgi:ribosomal-protein-alanine N-acetyltransferase
MNIKSFILMSLVCVVPCLAERQAPKPEVKNIFYDMPVLETKRLLLSQLTEEQIETHLEEFFAVFGDPEVARFMPWSHGDRTIEETRKRMYTLLERHAKGAPSCWTLIHKEQNCVIGRAGFWQWSPENAQAGMVIVLARDAWQLGYMTEALEAIIECAFNEMGLNLLHATIHPDNVASLKTFGKLGFKTVGLIPEWRYYRGAFNDRILVCLLKEEWIKSREKRK